MDPSKIDVANHFIANSFHLVSSCANPPDLNTTAFINTAASKHLVTPMTLTSQATSSECIIVIQPGGNKMHSTCCQPPPQQVTSACPDGPFPSRPHKQPSVRSCLMRCRMQSFLPCHWMQSHTQWQSHPMRTTQPTTSPLASTHRQQWVDNQLQGHG